MCNLLFTTGFTYPFGNSKYPVYENRKKELFVQITEHYPETGEPRKEKVFPMIWGDRPYHSNEVPSMFTDRFKEDDIKLGEVLKKADYKIIDIRLENALEIEGNILVTIVDLHSKINNHHERLKNLNNLCSEHLEKIQKLEKELDETQSSLGLLQHSVRLFWNSYLGLISCLQGVFKSKKWRKRFDKNCEDFYKEMDPKSIFEENIPF